ncbi:MAG: hypothetical protein GY856_07170, partial [bacterium]|nr:hypothetical protein [bacterium]
MGEEHPCVLATGMGGYIFPQGYRGVKVRHAVGQGGGRGGGPACQDPFTLVVNPGTRTHLREASCALCWGRSPDLAGLRRDLERELPEPLLPACVVVAALPRTPDGRVDRAALPEPPRRDAEEGFRGARDNRELRLLALVESTLKRRPISIRDNFFELGGTSLLALHLMSEIRHHFGVRLPVSILFEAPS